MFLKLSVNWLIIDVSSESQKSPVTDEVSRVPPPSVAAVVAATDEMDDAVDETASEEDGNDENVVWSAVSERVDGCMFDSVVGDISVVVDNIDCDADPSLDRTVVSGTADVDNSCTCVNNFIDWRMP